MIVCPLDIETTGLLQPDQRVIEVYATLYDTEANRTLDTFETRINPQRSIGIEAQRVHGITLPEVTGCPIFSTIAEDLRLFILRADLIVAHNGAGFDLPFINQEMRGAGRPEIRTPVFDTFLEGAWATPDGKKPNLRELCFACDVPYDTTLAHAASYDVGVLTQAFLCGLRWGWFKLPELESRKLAA